MGLTEPAAWWTIKMPPGSGDCRKRVEPVRGAGSTRARICPFVHRGEGHSLHQATLECCVRQRGISSSLKRGARSSLFKGDATVSKLPVGEETKGTSAMVAPNDPARNGSAHRGHTFARHFTTRGRHPFDEVEWELRTARITSEKGEVVVEQKGVEFPKFWSQLATNVVASKYFRGPLGSPDRERSVRQLIGRVVHRIREWGEEGGYFATPDDAEAFADELTYIL